MGNSDRSLGNRNASQRVKRRTSSSSHHMAESVSSLSDFIEEDNFLATESCDPEVEGVNKKVRTKKER